MISIKTYAVTIDDGTTKIATTTIQGVSFDGKIVRSALNIQLNVFDTTSRLVASSVNDINMRLRLKVFIL